MCRSKIDFISNFRTECRITNAMLCQLKLRWRTPKGFSTSLIFPVFYGVFNICILPGMFPSCENCEFTTCTFRSKPAPPAHARNRMVIADKVHRNRENKNQNY